MEMNDLINKQLCKYLSNEITKEDLVVWSIEVLHKMLDGGILKLCDLKYWKMITELAGMDDLDNTYCCKKVQHFLLVLSGQVNASFTFAIKIRSKFVVNNLIGIRGILEKYYSNRLLSGDEISTLEQIMNKSKKNVQTISDLLETQIIDLFNLAYEFDDYAKKINFELKSFVFMDEESATLLEDCVLDKLITLLKCYEGEKSFFIHSSFNSGIGNISIQV